MQIENLGLSLGTNTPTGLVELSSLKDIDISVGNKILELVAKLKVTIPSGVNDKHPRLKPLHSLEAFLKRPPEKQMGFGLFESPQRFLRAFQTKMTRNGEKDKNYKLELPLLFLARDLGINFSDTDRDVKKAKELQRDGSVIAEVDGYIVMPNYKLFVVGWYDDDVSTLALHVLTEIRSLISSANFEVSTAFADTEAFTLDWRFTDNKLLGAESATTPFDDGRLYCLSIDFGIRAELAKVRYVTEERSALSIEDSGRGH